MNDCKITNRLVPSVALYDELFVFSDTDADVYTHPISQTFVDEAYKYTKCGVGGVNLYEWIVRNNLHDRKSSYILYLRLRTAILEKYRVLLPDNEDFFP